MSTIKKINGLLVPNTFVTGFTYDNKNKLTILQNGRPDLNVYINNFSGLTVNGSISATTYYGDGSNLTGIVTTDYYVTGGTFSGSTLVLYRNGLSDVIITGFTSGISGDTYVSGFSYNNQNKLTILQNGRPDLNVYINNFSGLTVNGSISATTYYGDGIGLTNIPISGITNLQTNLNNKLNTSGGTITGNLIVNGDFTVLGTATTINTETLLVKDNIITLNSNYSGNTEPFIGNSGIEVLRGSATTATLLWDETNDYWVAGLSGSTKRILLSGDTTDYYVTGGTFSGSTLTLQRNGLLDITITGFTSTDTYVSGFSYNNQNKLTILQNGRPDLNVYINNFSGLTVNGSISATTYYGSGEGLINIPISGVTNLQTNLNNKFDKSGGTITGNLSVTGDTTTNALYASIVSGNTVYGNNFPDLPFTDDQTLELYMDSSGTTYARLKEIVSAPTGGTRTFLGNIDITSGLTVTGSTILKNGLTASTINISSTPTLSTTNTQFLTRNSTTGNVEYRNFNSIATGDTFVTGFSYSNNNITLSQNQNQSPITVNISTMTGLTINGNLSITGTSSFNTLTGNTPVFYGNTNVRGNLIVTGNTTSFELSATTFSSSTINTTITNNQVVFSNNGILSGSTNLTWTNSASTLTVRGNISGTTIYANDYPDLPLSDGQTLEIYTNTTGQTYVRLKEIVSAPTGGTRTFLGNIDITSGLTVTGSTILKDGLTASTLNLSLSSSTSNSNTQFLTRNSTTGNVEYRNFNSIATGDTFVTGFSYNKQNKLTISQNGQSDLNVYINEFSGISINGLSQPNGYALSVTGDTIFSGDVYVTGDLIYNGNLLVSGGTIVQSGFTANTIYTNYIDFNTSYAGATLPAGRLQWDDGNGTLVLGLKGGVSNIEIGLENMALCFNADSTTLTAGTIVYVSGSQGNRPSIKRALATTDGYSVTTLGMVSESIAPGATGFVTTYGMVNNLNTNGLTGGTALWLSPTYPGAYTATKPKGPDHTVLIAYVVRVHPNVGSVFVNISNGWEIDELHDVRLNGRTQGDLLIYSGYNGTNVWTNSKTLTGSYTINGDLTTTGTTSGGTFYGSGLGLTNIPISGVTNLQTELDKKFDKSGGTINGNLSVTGNTTTFELSATTFSSSTINTVISNNQVVFSNNGILSGSTNLTWTNSASTLNVIGIISGSTIYANDYPDLPSTDGQTIEIYGVSGQTYIRLKEIVSAPTGGTRTFLGNIDITSGLTVTGSTILKNGLTASTLNLSLSSSTSNSNTQFLTRNSTTGNVEYRNFNSVSTGDTYVTGFSYNDQNRLTISQNGQSDLNVFINSFSGLSVNGILTATTINTPITNNQIVYSNNGTLTGSTNLNWDNSTTTLSITGNTNNIGSISATTYYGDGLGLYNISNRILSITQLTASTLVTHTVGTTNFTAINLSSDTINRFAKTTFVAPPSGKVLIEMIFDMTINNSAAVQMIGLNTTTGSTSTPSEGWYRINADNDSNSGQFYARFIKTNLTPNTTYNYYFMGVCNFSGNIIRISRIQTDAYSAGSDLPAPLTITVYDLGSTSITTNPSS